MDLDRSMQELGWPEIVQALANRCRLPSGRSRALGLPLLSSEREVAEALQAVGEARELAELTIALPLGGLPDLAGHLERASKGGVLEPLALRECAALARAAGRTRGLLEQRAAPSPRFWALAQGLSQNPELVEAIERAIEPSGAISDRASLALAAARERSRGLHRALKVQVETLLEDQEMNRHLRDRYYTIRNERYVLPVLASARSVVKGIVHNASQSGQTLFVEPEAMVDLGNELSIASAMAAEEEQRILRELSDSVSRRAAELGRDLEILSALDVLEACARLASDLDAHAPAIGPVAGGFWLRSLRHPLLVLQGKKVVSSDVRLEPPQRALIVSGPNGGGKTVAVTAVGLSALMLRAGLPVPAAAGSRLPCYQQIQAAVDERGDLARDLSTFTAHLTAVREMALGAGPGSLVLVDEIAADTDPREGAALASAILEDLVERGAEVLVTTHLDELKALALSDPRFANARVGFDADRLVPTYQLHLGAPGSSSAIEVAGRVGLPQRVIDRARAALGGHGGALGTALRALEEERSRLEQERQGLERERQAARAAAEEARQQEQAARRAEKEASARVAEDLSAEVQAARAEVTALLKSLQSAPSVRKASQASAQLDAWTGTLEQAARVADAQASSVEEADPGAPLLPGTRVRIASLGQEGEVLELGEGEALVRAGALKARRPLSDLLPLRGRAAPSPVLGRGRKERLEAAASARAGALSHPDRRLDVRGLHVEELLREVDRFLDRLYRDGEPECLVLHGHGTGALKQALREHISASPYVSQFRPGERHEGGDAVTIVTLRK
jgi:DNA mismatch repair protein MutS2